MPTACSGYDPLIDTQMQCVIQQPTWNPNDRGGSWSYHFSGLPSCTLLGTFINILAIDTNTGLLPASPYLPDTDSVDHRYNFIEQDNLVVLHHKLCLVHYMKAWM